MNGKTTNYFKSRQFSKQEKKDKYGKKIKGNTIYNESTTDFNCSKNI